MAQGVSDASEAEDFDGFYEFAWQVPQELTEEAAGPSPFVTFGSKWGTSQAVGTPGGTVTWSLVGAGVTTTSFGFYAGASVALSGFLGFDFVGVLNRAFAAWSAIANINFVQVFDGGGAVGRGTTGSIRIAGGYIDGDSDTLAQAFSPGSSAISGDIVFDSSEIDFWNADSFLAVATHEIGHAIGLNHTAIPNQLMNASYNPAISTPQSDDIAGARHIYGASDLSARISDVTITEPDAGVTIMAFTVTRASTALEATVDFRSHDGSASAGRDYVAVSGTLSFAMSEASRRIEVQILGDTAHERNEWFTIELTRATGGATIADAVGIGVITDNDPPFTTANLWLAGFGTQGSWASNNLTPRRLADVNGDGMADIVGFAHGGVVVSLAAGGGTFGPARRAVEGFGVNGGWLSDSLTPRQLADVDGDGRADIVGFAHGGVVVSLADGAGGFGAARLAVAGFGVNGGWANDNLTPRHLADVNGDGMADILGFGSAGVYVSLATGGGGFGAARLAVTGFGLNGGWLSDDAAPRRLADVNGDGMADILGFGGAGVYVSLATGGGSFGAASLRLGAFGSNPAAGGWTSDDATPRGLGDVNGDGMADIVGFGGAGAFVALASGAGGFEAAELRLSALGSAAAAGGWRSDDIFPRFVADTNGDGLADLHGLGHLGLYSAFSNYPL
ncbi:VCBS repeat-containing protein [Roseococcus sp. SDR]|uniref:FG-GAP-like repeat-containing protein n=1 Tax=Roseococcus sp. SDR TaxID=2835532 RepID=UPI001BD1B1E1|nr:FG-GAP-like repeat-containing protein [Roseococcus sp. SDR]MBS7791846.1 VCBS repeat-containing protein [Roseococcus sp. SDR]MBV1847160.1 VCBS repeat-containing protein [Roseococcus sp. SDR]